MDSFQISSTDHVQVQAYVWKPEMKAVAVLQIVHGMQEHARRYDHFARWMNDHGIAVYADDHIGHGMSAKTNEELSHFPRKDDWQRSVVILHELTKKIKADHPGVPVFMLGHSMGSVLAQSYMILFCKEIDGYILSGVIRQPVFIAKTGQLVADLLSVLFGPADRSKVTVFFGYGQYNKQFKPNRTEVDWLCSEPSIVDDYLASPLCGKPLTNRFYHNLCKGFMHIAKPKNLAKIQAGIPVFLIAGASDPAGFNGKAPVKLKKLLIKYANADIGLKLYPDLRHEILNEVNREDIYRDVLDWMNKIIFH